ncbi:hypothetical protein LY76DRAFT_586187 [Colletotrichum caudatum]|nr:hypothetical protein LY76DRAFT_586187 [Colletotrichum caudatum]
MTPVAGTSISLLGLFGMAGEKRATEVPTQVTDSAANAARNEYQYLFPHPERGGGGKRTVKGFAYRLATQPEPTVAAGL